MMEISNETKAKVFAQYLGQMVFRATEFSMITYLYGSNIENIDDGNYPVSVLVLKPLDKITDEDAIEVGKILFIKRKVVRSKINPLVFNDMDKGYIIFSDNQVIYVDKYDDYFHGYLPAYQYLQSKGYDLPNYLLNGKTLHEAGLATYE